MKQFDPEIQYTAAELAEFIVSGTLTGADIPAYARPMQDNIEAEVHIRRDALRRELFGAMRSDVDLFGAAQMKCLLLGVDAMTRNAIKNIPPRERDITSRFILSAQTVTVADLIKERIVPEGTTAATLAEAGCHCPTYTMADLGWMPVQPRTDVVPLGLSHSGKTTLMAGVMADIYRGHNAVLVPHDCGVKPYARTTEWFMQMINLPAKGKFPAPTHHDTVNFAMLDVPDGRRMVQLTLCDTGSPIACAGPNSLLSGKNRKIPVFVIDYAVCCGRRSDVNDIEQGLLLDDILSALCHNGVGKGGETDCAMSNAPGVAVVMTKCDLMSPSLSAEARQKAMREILQTKYPNFVNNLHKACRRFGIGEPMMFTSSQPHRYVGGTFKHDNTDAARLGSYIIDRAPRLSALRTWLAARNINIPTNR